MLPILIKKGKIDFTYSRFHFWIALSMGLGYAILFFFFVVGMREMVRLSFYASEQDSKILLSDSEILFYNFFLAFISCLMGGSKCLEILVRANTKLKPYIRTSINTNQSGFLWFSVFWLSKMGAYLSFFLPVVISGTYFNLIDYWYVLIAILILLFYSQWNGFTYHFKNGLKIRNRVGAFYLLISVLISISSFFLLSGIGRVIQNNSVSFKYDIETPKSEIGRQFDFQNYSLISLYLGLLKSSAKDSFCVVGDAFTIELSEYDLFRYMVESKSCLDCEPAMVRLVVSKKAKMRDVNKTFKVLSNVNQRRIFLSTCYENWGIPFGLPPPCERDESKPLLIYQVCDAWVSISKEKVFSNIKLLKNEIFFNKTKLNKSKLYDSAMMHYQKHDSSAVFLITFDEVSKYETFMNVLDALFKANNFKKTEYASKELKRKYSFSETYFNDNHLYKKISARYPTNIGFYSEKDWQFLKQKFSKTD